MTGVFHNGLDRTEVRLWLKRSGFEDVTARDAHTITRPAADGTTRPYGVSWQLAGQREDTDD